MWQKEEMGGGQKRKNKNATGSYEEKGRKVVGEMEVGQAGKWRKKQWGGD